MTILEAINKADTLKPNQYTQSEKIGWLSVLDGMIKRNIIDTHEGGEDIEFTEYNDDTSLDTELIAYHPYDEIYPLWLSCKIDFHNGETARYNNSITAFNEMHIAFLNDYNRTHEPKGCKISF